MLFPVQQDLPLDSHLGGQIDEAVHCPSRGVLFPLFDGPIIPVISLSKIERLIPARERRLYYKPRKGFLFQF